MLTARLAFVLGHALAALAIIGLLVALYIGSEREMIRADKDRVMRWG